MRLFNDKGLMFPIMLLQVTTHCLKTRPHYQYSVFIAGCFDVSRYRGPPMAAAPPQPLRPSQLNLLLAAAVGSNY